MAFPGGVGGRALRVEWSEQIGENESVAGGVEVWDDLGSWTMPT